MKILLIISFLIPLLFIWFLLSKLGSFLEGDGLPVTDIATPASAIVLGGTKLAKRTTKLLEDMGIRVVQLTDPFQLTHEQSLCYLFALSDNDADNIAFYKIGRKLYNLKSMISICNDSRNENMFLSEKINYLSTEQSSAEILVQIILQHQPEVNRES